MQGPPQGRVFNGTGEDGGGKERKLRVQTAATELQLISLPGVFGLGKVPSGCGHRAGWVSEAGRWAARGPHGRRGGQAGLRSRPLKALSRRLPPPTTRWRRGQRGSPAGEVGGKRGEGRSRRNKKAAPPTPRSAEAGPGAQGGTAGGGAGGRPREWAYFFLSFAPPAPSMVNRSPRCLHAGRPPGSLRPKRWLPPHAEREGKASPEVGVRGGKHLVRPEAGEAGGNRRGPGPAPNLSSGGLSGPSPTHWPKRRRG